MGNKQSQKEKIKQEVMNNTEIQMKFSKVNETINKTTVEVINKVSDSMKVDSKTQLRQEMGGLKLSGIKDSSGVKIDISQVLDQSEVVNITSIQDIKQDSTIVQELQKKLATDLQNAMSSQQEASKSEGEQAMKELMGALSGAVGSAMQALNPGGQKSSEKEIETMIKNELKISNETEIKNKTENIMDNRMITETLSELASSFETYLEQVINGDIEISDVENSKDVGIALKQEAKITREVALKKMNETGMGSKIMAGLLEVDESAVKSAVDAGQKTAEKQQGTLEDAGGAISTAAKGVGEGVASGVGGVLQAMLGPMIVIGVVAIVGLFVVKPMLEKLEGDDIANIVAVAKGGAYKKMKGGSLKSISKSLLQKSKNLLSKVLPLLKKLLSKINPLVHKLYKVLKPYLTIRNLNIVLALLVLYQLISVIINMFKKENFENDELNKNYKIKVDGKYLKRMDGNIELVDNKDDASLVSLVKVIDNVFFKFGEEFALTNLGKKLKVMKNVPLFYPSQIVSYDKNEKSLKFGDDFVSIKDGKIVLSQENKAIVELEQ